MHIFLIGASGTIGQAVDRLLGDRHHIVRGSRSAGVSIDIRQSDSVKKALDAHGPFDAIVSTAGSVVFAPRERLRESDWADSWASKFRGQTRLLELGTSYLRDGGSITLTTGLTSQYPVRAGAVAASINGALEAFVASAALEMPRGQRVNAVSPGCVAESPPGHEDYFAGFAPVSVAAVSLAYLRSVEGGENGKTYRVHGS